MYFLLTRVAPGALKCEMNKRVRYDETLETNVRKFIKVLSREAVNCQTYAVYTKETMKSTTNPSPSDTKQQKQDNIKPKTNNDSSTKRSSSKKPPLCLWEKHRKKGIQHFLRHCKDCSKDKNDRLFELHRQQKDKVAKRTANATTSKKKSVVFNATFGGIYRTSLRADNCADYKILDSSTVNAMKKAGIEHKGEDLFRPREFEMAASIPDGNHAMLK